MSEITVDREPEKRRVERELGMFRIWFSLLSFLLCAVAFAIGFPALADAGKKIGLGSLALGLPFAIDLGMVTLLLWSMWNRGALKRWWPPMIPAGALLALSSYLQYIHAVSILPESLPGFARGGLLVLAAALPLLLALSAGVFEAVTFAPLIDRAKRHTTLLLEQQKADDELWRVESESRQARATLEAEAVRERMKLETEAQLDLMAAEAEAAAKAIRGTSKSSSSRRTTKPSAPMSETPPTPARKPAAKPVTAPVSPASVSNPDAKAAQAEPKVSAPSVNTSEKSLENPFLMGKPEANTPEVKPTESKEEAPTDEERTDESVAILVPEGEDPVFAAALAVKNGEYSQNKASQVFGVSRNRIRTQLGKME